MDNETRLKQAEEILKPLTGAILRKEENRIDAVVEIEKLKPAMKAMADHRWGYLMAITGLDHPATEDQKEGVLEVVYLFANENSICGIRTVAPYSNPVVPTVCDIFPNATLYERELMELLGVDVEGTPVRDRLVLSDDWPQGVYPLRKSFTGLPKKSA